MMHDTTFKRRKPWLAALLSFVTTGLGQFYNGQWKKGLGFFVVETVLGLWAVLSMGSFKGLVYGVAILLTANIFVAAEAYISARRIGEYSLKRSNRWWVYALLIIANVVVGSSVDFVVSGRLHQSFKIPSESMLQTLQVGDHLMAGILDKDDTVQRGEIIVFDDPNSGRHFVKRVIGLPGETIEMRDKIVFINGVRLDEPYTQHTKSDIQPMRDWFPPYRLGPEEYFMLGDNRDASYDSRWLGPIKRDSLMARVKYLYFPGNVGSEDWFYRWGMEIR